MLSDHKKSMRLSIRRHLVRLGVAEPSTFRASGKPVPLQPEPENPMAKYLLLLHQAPTRLDKLAPEEIQRIIGEYSAWRADLVKRKQMHGGEKLTDSGGRRLRVRDGKVVATDGPFSEAAEVLGG